MWFSVLSMVVVGGITRLTGSGLSMVEWQPLIGVVPPLDQAAWQRAFARYQEFPQFLEVNHWMGLDDFKRIFFWEYVHRLVGRSIGLVVFVPWLVLVLRGRLSRRLSRRVLGAVALGGAQGVLGWYMVESGLVDRPEVSHLRLASHLLLAFGVGQWVLWTVLDEGPDPLRAIRAPAAQRASAWGFVALLALQVLYGAFMAGTRAGGLYASFPDMNGSFGPGPFFVGPLARDLLHNPAAIHWVHRTLAWLVLATGMALALHVRRLPGLRARADLLMGLLLSQVLLGALTVVYGVPLGLAVAHQGCAFLLLSSAVAVCHALGGIDESDTTPEARAGDGWLARQG